MHLGTNAVLKVRGDMKSGTIIPASTAWPRQRLASRSALLDCAPNGFLTPQGTQRTRLSRWNRFPRTWWIFSLLMVRSRTLGWSGLRAVGFSNAAMLAQAWCPVVRLEGAGSAGTDLMSVGRDMRISDAAVAILFSYLGIHTSRGILHGSHESEAPCIKLYNRT